MTARQQALKLAADLGVTVEVERDNHPTGAERRETVYRVEAPEGNHWSDGVHELCESNWQGVVDRLIPGTEPCSEECEWW